MGCTVLGMTAIFTYNLPVSQQRFEEARCALYTLTDYHCMIEQAVTGGYIQEDEQKTLIDWRKDPNAWAAKFTQNA
jgi:orotate phosphoribosyltransferase